MTRRGEQLKKEIETLLSVGRSSLRSAQAERLEHSRCDGHSHGRWIEEIRRATFCASVAGQRLKDLELEVYPLRRVGVVVMDPNARVRVEVRR